MYKYTCGVNTIAVENDWGYCKQCDKLIRKHPVAEPKPMFIRYKKGAAGMIDSGEALDVDGWVDTSKFDPLEDRWLFIGYKEPPPPPEPVSSLHSQKVVRKNGKTKYNILVYDIHEEDGNVLGTAWMFYITIGVRQISPGTWVEDGKRSRTGLYAPAYRECPQCSFALEQQIEIQYDEFGKPIGVAVQYDCDFCKCGWVFD